MRADKKMRRIRCRGESTGPDRCFGPGVILHDLMLEIPVETIDNEATLIRYECFIALRNEAAIGPSNLQAYLREKPKQVLL